jgi:hypothetical protein
MLCCRLQLAYTRCVEVRTQVLSFKRAEAARVGMWMPRRDDAAAGGGQAAPAVEPELHDAHSPDDGMVCALD